MTIHDIQRQHAAYRADPDHMARMRAYGEWLDNCANCHHGTTWHHNGQCELAMEHYQCDCPTWQDPTTQPPA
jgi:hypothetical protein